MRLLNDLLWRMQIPLLLGVIALSMWGLTIDMPMNAPFVWAWHWLAAPVLGISWFYAFTQRSYFLRQRKVRRPSFYICSLLGPPMILLFCGGIVALANASFPTGENVCYSGQIASLHISGGRSKSYCITLHDSRTDQEITLMTSKGEYSHLAPGQSYQREMSIGMLGLPFRR